MEFGDDELDVYEQLFGPHGFTPRQFKALLDVRKRIMTLAFSFIMGFTLPWMTCCSCLLRVQKGSDVFEAEQGAVIVHKGSVQEEDPGAH